MRYRVGTDNGWHEQTESLRHAARTIRLKAHEHGGGRIRWPDADGLGPKRTGGELGVRMLVGAPRRLGLHDVVVIVCDDGFHLRLRREKAAPDKGREVARYAISQLGAPYVWADANPIGPAGGEGSGFDCSGLVGWAHAQVGEEWMAGLTADGMYHSDRVIIFHELAELRVGDPVFYDASPRLGTGPAHADHTEVYIGDGMSCGASSGVERVVIRPYNTNKVIGFGRIEAINGKP